MWGPADVEAEAHRRNLYKRESAASSNQSALRDRSEVIHSMDFDYLSAHPARSTCDHRATIQIWWCLDRVPHQSTTVLFRCNRYIPHQTVGFDNRERFISLP